MAPLHGTLKTMAGFDNGTPLGVDMTSDGFNPSVTRRRLSATMITQPMPTASADVAAGPPGSAGRRTSVLTEILARSSTSPGFIEKEIKPTLIIAMLHLKDPHPDIDRLRRVLGERILLIPRFCSVFCLRDGKVFCDAVPPDDVDLAHHIQTMDGEGTFGSSGISALISDASQEWWDASLPLWKFTLVTNTADGGSLLFCKIDHAIGDGVAMVRVLESLLDDRPDGMSNFQVRRPTPPRIRWSTKLIWTLCGIYDGTLGWLITRGDPDNHLKIKSDKKIGDAGSKTFTLTRKRSLAEIKEMASRLSGASVNDVVLASVSIGIRRYLEKTKDPVLAQIDRGGTYLQAMSLVNLRGVGDKDKEKGALNLGNDFAALNFPLPLNFRDEIDAVFKIKHMMDYYKVSPAVYLMKVLGYRLLALLPETALIQASLENIRKPSCMISNVMGPPFECKLAGYALVEINFLASSVIGLYVGLISYNGDVRISFATDKLASIDCNLFQECLEGAMDDLEGKLLAKGSPMIERPEYVPTAARLLEYALPVIFSLFVGWLYSVLFFT